MLNFIIKIFETNFWGQRLKKSTQIFNYDEIGGIPYSLQDRMVSGTLHVKSVVRGYHVYKDNWILEVGDRFEVKIEEMNCYDCYYCRLYLAIGPSSSSITSHVPSSAALSNTLSKLEENDEIRIM